MNNSITSDKPDIPINNEKLILLTGATGYVGGRLLKELEKNGHRIRCLARRPDYLRSRTDAGTEIVKGDVLDLDSLKPALQGVDIAYYMVHSMGSKGAFEKDDRIAASNFGESAREAGVERIIYLGGLGDDEDNLSPHLRSRQEVGKILRESGVPVIEFRASIIIGSGSLSFEMIRILVERLPVMITPRWVSISAQPIAIEDLIRYLIEALDLTVSSDRIFEIGGSDIVSYEKIMRIYAKCRNIRIRMVRVPVLTPGLSSLWLGLVTPLYARIGRKLIESIVHPTIIRDNSAIEAFKVKPMSIEDAVRHALANEDEEFAATRWSDALSSTGERTARFFGIKFGARLIDSRTIKVDLSPEYAFIPIQLIGGENGWYAWNWLWKIRGLLDMIAGGVGMRRGRPDSGILRNGDPIDFWRIEKFEQDHLLRLSAEMKVPGRAWLEFEVNGDKNSSTIRQTAIFDPVGLFGRLYWYALYPVHQLVFSGMLKGIAESAKKVSSSR